MMLFRGVLLLGLLVGTADAGPPRETAGSDPPLPIFRVDLSDPGASAHARGLGLDILLARPGQWALVLGWPGVEDDMQAVGLCFEQISPEEAGLPGPVERPGLTPASEASSGWNVPPEGQGSLAGFWTYAEVNALLDSLATQDPLGLVTAIDTVGFSLQGRPILALGITDTSRPLGTRPEVLLTALTHAREPQGMQTLMHFVLRLLEGYGVDPEATYLVNERELWIVPVVNPDGYVRNENSWVANGSFSFWRKNLRDNNGDSQITGADGVDLNRNFGFMWGVDNSGSSPNPIHQAYRGPSAWSEPETQALRAFCNRHAFRTANNLHTYYETCLYPWGHTQTPAPDVATFIRIADAVTRPAGYSYGASEEILYPVNGDANDWMYGETVEKPSVFALTTEIGTQNDNFWPPRSRILPLSRLEERPHRVLAYAAGVYLTADSLRVETTVGVLRPGEVSPAVVRLRHDGVSGTTGGALTASLVSLHSAVSVLNDEATYPGLSPGQAAWPEAGSQFLLSVSPAAVPGTPVDLVVVMTDAAGYYGTDTLAVRLGEPSVVFADDGSSGLLHWTSSGGWGVEVVQGDPAFSDSPGAFYDPNTDRRLVLNHALDLSGAVHAVLRFRTQWGIETGYDFGRVEASTDSGGSWTALAGGRTRPGHGVADNYQGGTQPLGTPGYDGNARFWVDDEIDLSAFAGLPDVRLRFRLTSDVAVDMEGWLVDDVRVLAYAPATPLDVPADGSPVVADRGRPLVALAAAPNPFRERVGVSFAVSRPVPVKVSVFDAAGREVRVLSEGLAGGGARDLVWDGRGAEGRPLPAGVYFVQVRAEGQTETAKVILVR